MNSHTGDWMMTLDRAYADAAKDGRTLDRLMVRQLLADVERSGWTAGYVAGSQDAHMSMQEKVERAAREAS